MPIDVCNKLAIVAIAKNETPYLVEWIAYQLVMGADHIYLYNNGHDELGESILGTLNQVGMIDAIRWTGDFPHGPQVPAYNHALRQYGEKFDWMAFVDLDEFIVPLKHSSLKSFLGGKTDVDAIWVPWLIFGSAGQHEYSANLMIERFERREFMSPETLTPIKSIVRPGASLKAGVHVHELRTACYENPKGNRDYIRDPTGAYRASQLADGFDILRIHHYMTKSQNEWRLKVERGRADRGGRDISSMRSLEEFPEWDRNEVFDRSAQKFRKRLKEQISKILNVLENESIKY